MAQFWSTHTDEAQPQFGLSSAEFAAHLYLVYTAEVGNGGHSQFFMNPYGAFAQETLLALRQMDLVDLASILAEACRVFPGARIVKDDALRRQAVRGPEGPEFDRWRALDHRFDQVSRNADIAVLGYLRWHHSDVLAPERGQERKWLTRASLRENSLFGGFRQHYLKRPEYEPPPRRSAGRVADIDQPLRFLDHRPLLA